jgi:hypothetical protein
VSKQRRTDKKQPGQALVELALSITFIFFLLAATVDLGLIFFTLQGLRTAAQEGATYGSYPVRVVNSDGSTKAVDLNYLEIARRVRNSGGTTSSGFANLQDLDGNGVRDDTELYDPKHGDQKNPDAWIFVELMGGSNANNLTAGSCPTDEPGFGMQDGGRGCWIRVTVRYNYRLQFPLAPAFGNTVRLQVRQVIPVRSSFYFGG